MPPVEQAERFLEKLDAWASGDTVLPRALALLETAQELLRSGAAAELPAEAWHRYLDLTRRPRFLQALPDRGRREAWAETCFALIPLSGYTLEAMLAQRVAEHPQRTLFQEGWGTDVRTWSYAAVAERMRAFAGALLAVADRPRVAIFADNGLDGACCDLACLTYGLLVTPLSPHLSPEALAYVLDELRINVVVTETEEQRANLAATRPQLAQPPHVLLLDPEARIRYEDELRLAEAVARLGRDEIDARLAEWPRLGLDELATVMFTSGSTGMPKGVCYTPFNLISKRFARAAALPDVGEGEVLLSYLPLFHTFGRYLEMMGMLFWGGTYVFAGNPSLESLLAGLRAVQPTGLISVPHRWAQIRERCLAAMGVSDDNALRERAFRGIVGDRLRWGLSAAGRLESAAFRFFQRHGVALCSGFGMTEATGGITMTPPGEYEDDSVGIPLPGITPRLSDAGELQIRGPYVARYLDEPEGAGTEGWFATGDIFQLRESGHYEIVDRIKDIYKNSKGQTIAPAAVERRLSDVPGIRRTFLVGDGRDANVLLIVPDPDEPALAATASAEEIDEYYRQVITTANKELAPFERVVNFALLARDFSAERGEVTPKGSLRRKVVEEHFAETIEGLYRKSFVELAHQGLRVHIPRWFFRDLGVLETDIAPRGDGLFNRGSGRELKLVPRPEPGLVEIGDLLYRVAGDVVDLGLFSRQPMLWVANPALCAFGPCKEGWDIPLGDVSPQVLLPPRGDEGPGTAKPVTPEGLRTAALAEVNVVATTALFGDAGAATDAVRSLEGLLRGADNRIGPLIRRRLEALARHPAPEVRCLAYQTLLLDEPTPDYGHVFPSFVESGLSFLSEESIEAIANARAEPYRLDALRRRMQRYRNQLAWPARPEVRALFDDVFTLLVDFARHHLDFYTPVRAELTSWVLFDRDPELAQRALEHFEGLARWFEGQLEARQAGREAVDWRAKIAFQDRLTPSEIERLEEVLVGTTFLEESLLLAFDGAHLDLDDVPREGIWISRVYSLSTHRLYRVSVNTRSDDHYDLLLVLRRDIDAASVRKSIRWMIALHGQILGPPVVARFGCARPKLGAFSLAYVSDLTVWERVRELTAARGSEPVPGWRGLRSLMVRALSAFFTGWAHSGRRIVPGAVAPTNVVVPAADYRTDVAILSVAGWQPYEGPLSLVAPMFRSFFLQTVSHYPVLREALDVGWIFEACVEALGVADGRDFLVSLREELESQPELRAALLPPLERQLAALDRELYVPLAVRCAVDRYRAWEADNDSATPQARQQLLVDLDRLYQLPKFGAPARYLLYRQTYFAPAAHEVTEAFDRLLEQMFERPELRPTRMLELSALQATLSSSQDRLVLSRMVFSVADLDQPFEVAAVGERDQAHARVVVISQLTDSRGQSYRVREPTEPGEIGKVLRVFLAVGLPLRLATGQLYYVVLNREDEVVAGICYRQPEPEVVHLDGIARAGSLKGRGISAALLEDFCVRMTTRGVRVVATHFVSQDFYRAHGFQVDRRWGGLVRFLG